MNLILAVFAYLITIPIFVCWLLFCLVLAFFGVFVSRKQIIINLNEVHDQDTICKVLNAKGVLSDEAYNFEINIVAAKYDELTFIGYIFILNPIIFLLKRTTFMDHFIGYLVHKWMEIHYFNKEKNYKPGIAFSSIAQSCVYFAGVLGQFLHRVMP
jgi:hypothetical protein